MKNKVEDIPIEEFENDKQNSTEEFLKLFPKKAKSGKNKSKNKKDE